MKISIAQFKSELGKVEENFSMAARLILMARNSDVILLPELWSTGYYPTPVENFADIDGKCTIEFLRAAARKFNVNIIGGSVIVKSDGKIFNRCFVVNRRGELVAAYDKTHLFSFAEENDVFRAGDKIATFELDGVRCGVAVCYDLRFPEFIRKIALTGAEIIFIPAAWSLKRLIPRQILTKARAIENQVFIVFANSSGKSEVVNPCGEVIAKSECGEKLLTVKIDLNERAEVIDTMNLLADRNLSVDLMEGESVPTKRDGGIVYEKLVWDDDEIPATQTNSPSSAVNDELKEIFKIIFGERDVWEVIDREGFTIVGTKSEDFWEYEQSMQELYGDDYKKKLKEFFERDFKKEQNKLTAIQKKMFLKKVCDGKYTEGDLIFIRAVEDFSSGFAFTKDAFCIGGDLLDFQTYKFPIVRYDEITSIEIGGYSSDWVEKKVPNIHIRFRKKQNRYNDSIFFNVKNVRNKYATQIITERILWKIGKFLEFVKA